MGRLELDLSRYLWIDEWAARQAGSYCGWDWMGSTRPCNTARPGIRYSEAEWRGQSQKLPFHSHHFYYRYPNILDYNPFTYPAYPDVELSLDTIRNFI
jgi:hypothetical protein